MAAKFILLLIISLIVLVFAIIILTGKGDKLIAGYNTSTEEEKEKYNIKRVRICIGGMLLILSPIMLMFADNFIILIAIVPPLSILSVILTKTWAKKYCNQNNRPIKTSAGRPSEDLPLMGREVSEVCFQSASRLQTHLFIFNSTSGAE